MTWDLVIFDCDGVLVDSEPIAHRILVEMLADIGLPMTHEEAMSAFLGLTDDACLEIIERRLGRPVPGFFDQMNRRTFEAFRRELQPVPRVIGVLDLLERKSIPHCVASSGIPEKMRTTLGATGLLPRFEGRMFSATEVPRGKPSPDLFLYAAEKMGVPPLRCAVIEDAVPGVEAAVAAAMAPFGYAGSTDGRLLAEAGATVFSDMAELPRLLRLT